MDNDQRKSRGLFSSSYYDQPVDGPVTSSPEGRIVSPYLNFDPQVVRNEADQFIFPEGAGRHRGRFELMFSQIGGSVFAGAAVGGINGLFTGYKEIQGAKDMSASVRRTQMLNFITKRGAASAQSLGVIALMYSLFGVGLQLLRGEDDQYNTLTAATATGMLYKASGGLKKSMVGGGVGLGLATVYVLFLKSDTFKSYMNKSR